MKDPQLRSNLFWFELKCLDEQIGKLQQSEARLRKQRIRLQSKRVHVSQLAKPPE